jgi:hypothetical protein
MNDALATLCLDHLHNEAAMLTTALSIVGAIKKAFGERGLDAFTAALGRNWELTRIVADIQRRRRQFAESTAGRLGLPWQAVTISAVTAHLPENGRATVIGTANRVRTLAQDLAAANFVVSVHIRVHLDAYRRILRDLTNTRAGSGRYSPAGHAEVLDYRPMLQING